jgi:CCR4-NOT transcription complex subunit 1
VLTSMAMHLRYPNAHTHWFSSLILHLFAASKDEKFKEIVTKVLLERFIGHRPHPWGVLVTFIELLRGPKYDFWNREFVRAVPEISLLLESVRECVLVSFAALLIKWRRLLDRCSRQHKSGTMWP